MLGYYHAIQVIKLDEVRVLKYELVEDKCPFNITALEIIDHNLAALHLPWYAHCCFYRDQEHRRVECV